MSVSLKKLIEGNPGSKDNAKIAYNFLVEEKGYKPEIALGIVGNLMKESYTDIRPNAVGDNNTAYGIAQWRGDRLNNLKKIRPDDFNTLKGQLEFIDWELNNTEKRAGIKLNQAKTIEDATLAFSTHYERPHKDYADNTTRIKHATNLGGILNVTDKKGVTEPYVAVEKPVIEKNSTPPPLATAPINPNYAALPEKGKPEATKEGGISEDQVRKLLSQEKETTEQRFMDAFQQQNAADQPEYQPQQEDLSYLYDYIDIENFADGGKYKKYFNKN